MKPQNNPATAGGNNNHRELPSTTWLNSLVQQSDMPSVFRDLLHPGKDAIELVMRTIFPDEAKANAAVLFIHRLEEFGLWDEYKNLALSKIASFASIGGMARREAVMAATGVISSALYNIKPSNNGKNSRKDNSKQDQGEDE